MLSTQGYFDTYEQQEIGAPEGYSRLEIGMGWRLSPPGEAAFSMKQYLPRITSGDIANSSGGNTQCESRSGGAAACWPSSPINLARGGGGPFCVGSSACKALS